MNTSLEQLGADAHPLTGTPERVGTLVGEAWTRRYDDPDRALELAAAGLALATSFGDTGGVAAALTAQAFALFRLARLGEARESAERSRDLCRQLGDREGLARALNTLGMVYGESGELLGALGAFLNAEALYSELADTAGKANALNNVGNTYSYLGDYVNALDYYQQSLTVCREVHLPEAQVRALVNIGVTYYELKQFQEALEYLERALAAVPDPDAYTRALCFLNLGRNYQQIGQPELAQTHLERGLALSRELGDLLTVASALDSLADLSLAAGETSAARAVLEESLKLKEGTGDLKGQSETLLLLATADRCSGDLEGAAARLGRVLELSERVGNPLERYEAFRQLSEVHERRGALQEALTYYRQYSELHEQVARGTVSQQLQGLRLRFEVSQAAREHELYRQKNAELARLNADLEALNRALREADREKTRLLAELVRQTEEDALTGLHNRRHFDEVFARSFGEAQRLGTPLSVVISDIDNFKAINDRFSHGVGDEVLRIIAGLMREALRAIDTVARYGGEEFVMLLPGAPGHDALTICERLRAAVESYGWGQIHPNLRVTLSVGLSDDLSVENHERMLALADAKLYKAKHNGKNQVCL